MVGDGPDREPLERAASRTGAHRRACSFVGEQHDLGAVAVGADVFLLPSAQESFGLAALEAMACEVPVVASRVGGLPEVVEDGVTGFLCALDAVDVMAARAIELLTDEAHRLRIGRAAAARVRAHFCTEDVVPLYEQAYRDVLSST